MSQTDNFAMLVSEDIKNNASQQDKDFLRLPENQVKWRDALITIVETVTAKIASLDEEISRLRGTYTTFTIDPAAGLEEQRDKAARFRFYAEKRLVEVDRLLTLGEEADPELSLATFLRNAILAHKQWHIDNDMVNSEGDDCLYKALDGVWGF